tara:strand:- start:28198 stop:29952 length:1755 start_codon:yes stop_codon:yes gene_type:complete
MATTIEQEQLYPINPSTFHWMYVFRNNTIVSGVPVPYWNVSFNAAIFLGEDYVSLGSMNNVIAETKTVPNNAGVGIFNLQRFLESYTAPQYNNYLENSRPVRFHGVAGTTDIYFPIHVIDKYSQNDNCIRFVKIGANLNGALQPNLPAIPINGTATTSNTSLCFNGYIQSDFALTRIGKDFGFDYTNAYAPISPNSYGILSDAPRWSNNQTLQYAGSKEYGVISFFNQIFNDIEKPDGIEIVGFLSDGTTESFLILNIDANGGTTTLNAGVAQTAEHILFAGVFPGNLRQAHSQFAGWIQKGLDCYTFRLYKDKPAPIKSMSKSAPQYDVCIRCEGESPILDTWKYGERGECRYDTITACERANYGCERCLDHEGNPTGFYRWGPFGPCIYFDEEACIKANEGGGPDPDEPTIDYLSGAHKICLNCDTQPKGFIPIRITWLNSMGGWDYYTFNMKSSTQIKTKRNDWQQLEGSWNKDSWNPQGFKGGKKAFSVNTIRSITANTNYISEQEAQWFEFLINSPEIYIIEEWEAWRSATDIQKSYEKYVTPVLLKTSSFKRKTVANDNIIQYSFKFEQSRTLNTQPV